MMNNPYDPLFNPPLASPVIQNPTAIEVPEAVLEAEKLAEMEAEMARAQAEAEKKKVQKMHSRFRRAQLARAPKEKIWAEIDEFDRGEQWKNANIPPWVPKPVTNFIRHFRTLKRANLTGAISRPTFSPVAEEDAPIVQRLQLAHDHVWDYEKVPRTIRRCVDRAISLGTSIAMVYTDDAFIGGKYYPDEPILDPATQQPMLGPDGQPLTRPNSQNKLYQGKICVKKIPVENFFPDPDAYRLEDCKFIEITEIVPFATIKNNKLFRKYAGDKIDALVAPRPDTEDSASGEIFKRDNKVTESTTGEPGDEVVTLHTHYERYMNEHGKWQLDITYYLQNTDFILYKIVDAKPNEYPFAIYYDEEEDKDFWATSQAMTGMLEAQKLINKVQQVSAVIGALHQNPQKVVMRESGINAQKLARSGNVPGQVWESNIPGEQAIQIIKPPDIPRGLFELDERTKADIRDIAGLNEAYMGQSVGSLTTSTGVESLIERATIRDRDKMVQIDEFVERISHLIVLNIIHKWEDERPIPTVNPDGSVNFDTWQPLDKITAENLEWRVKSNIYAKSPITQATRRQQADKLLQMQGQFQFQPAVITPEEWIKFQEFDDAPEILRRMQAERQQMMMQQQMQASGMIQQMIMQLAQGMAQGQIPPEGVQQMVDQMTQQLFAMVSPGAMNGTQQPSAPGQPNLPKGATSQVAMANMAQG